MAKGQRQIVKGKNLISNGLNIFYTFSSLAFGLLLHLHSISKSEIIKRKLTG